MCTCTGKEKNMDIHFLCGVLFASELPCLILAPFAFFLEEIDFGCVLFAIGLLLAAVRGVISIIAFGLSINAIVELVLVLSFLIGMIIFWIHVYRDFFS